MLKSTISVFTIASVAFSSIVLPAKAGNPIKRKTCSTLTTKIEHYQHTTGYEADSYFSKIYMRRWSFLRGGTKWQHVGTEAYSISLRKAYKNFFKSKSDARQTIRRIVDNRQCN